MTTTKRNPERKVTKEEHDENGNLTYQEWSNGGWFKYEHNATNQKIRYETSDGYWEQWSYNDQGLETYWEDSLGCSLHCEYTGQCKVVNRKNPLFRDTRETYDLRGNLILKEEIVVEYRYEYDDLNRKTYELDSRGNYTRWIYHADGTFSTLKGSTLEDDKD